jgi:hypothetical protein
VDLRLGDWADVCDHPSPRPSSHAWGPSSASSTRVAAGTWPSTGPEPDGPPARGPPGSRCPAKPRQAPTTSTTSPNTPRTRPGTPQCGSGVPSTSPACVRPAFSPLGSWSGQAPGRPAGWGAPPARLRGDRCRPDRPRHAALASRLLRDRVRRRPGRRRDSRTHTRRSAPAGRVAETAPPRQFRPLQTARRARGRAAACSGPNRAQNTSPTRRQPRTRNGLVPADAAGGRPGRRLERRS